MKGCSGLPAGTGCGAGEHGFDWLDTGDRFLGKWESECNCAEQFAIDIDRASAHALHYAGFGERTATQPGENNGLLWSEVFENAEDFDLELFDLLTLKNGPPYAVRAGPDIFEWEEALSSAGPNHEK
jgi:hypothetical protein